MEKVVTDRLSGGAARVVIQDQLLNFVGCCIATCIYVYLVCYSDSLFTLDALAAICMAEVNRWRNDLRRRKAIGIHVEGRGSLNDKLLPGPTETSCLAAVVGYREDPRLFRKCLESYIHAEGCRFTLVCIDGDEDGDEEMRSVFHKVYPQDAAHIHLDTPLAQRALEYLQAVSSNGKASRGGHLGSSVEEQERTAILHCRQIVKKALSEHHVELCGDKAITKLCVQQPHMHKKGILFTAFIFALVISEVLHLDFMWVSDSDSWITSPDAIHRTILTVARNPEVGGASTSMEIHNFGDSITTALNNGIYTSEICLVRSFTAAVGANECQSGPCSLFRIEALPPILLKWYMQRVAGHWMIVNEDRHLTSRLLLEGWRVTFASDVSTATESPSTFRRYLIQQVRWARAVHIETFYLPRVYLMQSPVFFFNALKRVPAVVGIPITVLVYLTRGSVAFRSIPPDDIVKSFLYRLVYLFLRSPHRPSWRSWLWILPAQLFYWVTAPAINLWGCLTVLNDSWGTNMRSSSEISKKHSLRSKIFELGFFVVWIALVSGATGRMMAEALELSPTHLILCIWAMMLPVALVSATMLVLAD